MSWIDYYVGIIALWIIILFSMLLFKKTRFFAFSLFFSTVVLFIGLKFIEKIVYDSNIDYQTDKKISFKKVSKSHREVVINITPSSWLTKLDGRGKNSLIPFKNREKIGGYLPLGSAPNILTLQCSEDEGFIYFKTDRFGFRNDDKLWNNKFHDIVLIGDSFAESACVKKSLQEYFNETIKIVSIGKGGNGPLTSLASLSEYTEVYQPKAIYHLIVENDYARSQNNRHNYDIDLEREWEDPQLQKYLKNPNFNMSYFDQLDLSLLKNFAIHFSKEALIKKNYEEIDFVAEISELFSYRLIKKIIQSLSSKNKFSVALNQEMRFIEKEKLIAVYKGMIEKAKSKNIEINFVILPTKSVCINSLENDYLSEIFHSLNKDTIDFRSELCNPKLFAINGSHFNYKGYEKLADLITLDFNSKKK